MDVYSKERVGLGIWCLTPLSTRVGREIPVVGIPSGNYQEIPSWEIL
jgi:hypothetical protein